MPELNGNDVLVALLTEIKLAYDERAEYREEVERLTTLLGLQHDTIEALTGDLDDALEEDKPKPYKPRKLTYEQVKSIQDYSRWGYPSRWIANRFNVSPSTVSRIVNR